MTEEVIGQNYLAIYILVARLFQYFKNETNGQINGINRHIFEKSFVFSLLSLMVFRIVSFSHII